MARRHVFHTVLLVVLLCSCQSDRLDVDISEVDVEVELLRFDQDLRQADFEHLEITYQGLYQKHGSFLEDYLEIIMRIGPADDPRSLGALEEFVEEPQMKQVFKDIDEIHSPHMNEYESEFTDAMRRLKYHFDDQVIPDIIFHHSGFNVGVYPTDSILAIGLDFYLGTEHPVVQLLDPNVFPQYTRNKMRPEYMVSDALKGMLLVRFQDLFKEDNMLDQTMYYGKVMYCLDALLPEVEDSIKMQYTTMEMEWCEANKTKIWNEYANQQNLEESRNFEIQKWIQDAPFTGAAAIPQDSPSRLGVWIAWQVVRDYMNANEEVTLPALMADDNYYKFMRFYDPS